jgi:hypothetical protein
MFTNVYPEKSQKSQNPIYYECKKCNYITSSKKDYGKHCLTKKHAKVTNVYQMLTDIDQKIPKIPKIPDKVMCVCGKTYSYKQSLSHHKKKCNIVLKTVLDDNDINNNSDKKNENDNDNLNYKEIIFQLINQNKKLQDTISELIPKVGNNNNNVNNINIINNINFLNDKCKDAISINEFIETIEFKVKNLLNTSKNGLPIGLSNIFIEHYNNLPLIKRPLWCSDKKRKKLYIKEDEWKEDINHEKTKEIIKTLAFKQARNVKKYKEENPDFMNNDRKKDAYISILKETTSDFGDQKQNIVINKLLDTIHLNEETKEMIQNTI